MYLLVFEDFTFKMAESIDDDDRITAEDGYMLIFDVSDPKAVKEFGCGDWPQVSSEWSDEQ